VSRAPDSRRSVKREDEKMDMRSSLVIAGGIVLGFLILGMCQRFEVVAPSGNSHVFLLDKATGKIWMKFQQSSSGPTNWERIDPK
jgi:hypothetical protein